MKLIEVVSALSEKYAFNADEAMQFIRTIKPKKVKLVVVEKDVRRILPASITNLPASKDTVRKVKKPRIQVEKPQIQVEKPQIQVEKPQIQVEKPQIQVEKPHKLKSILKRYRKRCTKRVSFVSDSDSPVCQREEQPVCQREEEPVCQREEQPVCQREEEPVCQREEQPVCQREEQPVCQREEEPVCQREEHQREEPEDEGLVEYIPPLEFSETNEKFPLLL